MLKFNSLPPEADSVELDRELVGHFIKEAATKEYAFRNLALFIVSAVTINSQDQDIQPIIEVIDQQMNALMADHYGEAHFSWDALAFRQGMEAAHEGLKV